MKLLTKTPVAILIMVVVILASGTLGCRRSLLSARKNAEDYFYNNLAEDRYNESIQTELSIISGIAINLKNIATPRYIDSNDKVITDLIEARKNLDKTESISEKYTAAQRLFDAVTALYDSLNPDTMNSTDKGFRASLYDDIKSAMQRISHSDYNDTAREFNSLLEHYPAKFIAEIAKIEPLQLYG